MWFEQLLLLALLASSVFLIGIPLFKLVRAMIPKKRNPLAEAQVRLEQARLEVEAARLEKERSRLYNKMIEETLQDDEEEDTKFQQQINRRNINESEK
jgi:uncharacterized protein (DUF3084 family)